MQIAHIPKRITTSILKLPDPVRCVLPDGGEKIQSLSWFENPQTC